jgi:hypothetical protein
MSQSQRVTGSSSMSYPSPIEGMECRTSSATWTLGFRLVHDTEERVRRGRAWPDRGDNETSVRRYPYGAGFYNKFLGFRLAFDREGQ